MERKLVALDCFSNAVNLANIHWSTIFTDSDWRRGGLDTFFQSNATVFKALKAPNTLLLVLTLFAFVRPSYHDLEADYRTPYTRISKFESRSKAVMSLNFFPPDFIGLLVGLDFIRMVR